MASRVGAFPGKAALPPLVQIANCSMMVRPVPSPVVTRIAPAVHVSPTPMSSRPQFTGGPCDPRMESRPEVTADHFEAPPQPPTHEPPATASFMELDMSRTIMMFAGIGFAG